MAYKNAPRPIPYLFVSATLSMAALLAFDVLSSGRFSGFMMRETQIVQVFIVLLIFYFSVWLAYFASVRHAVLRFQTLRVLLWEHALHSQDIEQIREKGRSTLTTQAIFTAISVFVISAIHNKGPLEFDNLLTSWAAFSSHLVLACALLAVILFILSADAVETTFNSFDVEESRHVQYFFRISAFRKYFGFVLAVLAVVIFVSTISPFVATIGLVAFLIAGYSHWFPWIERRKRKREFLGFIALMVGFVVTGVWLFG